MEKVLFWGLGGNMELLFYIVCEAMIVKLPIRRDLFDSRDVI